MVMKEAVKDDVPDALRAFAVGDERLEVTPGALWFFHPDGVGQSKLAEKAAQVRLTGMGTARNWNTVTRLAEMVGAVP
jgi:uncharacterized protein (DUF1697 family)